MNFSFFFIFFKKKKQKTKSEWFRTFVGLNENQTSMPAKLLATERVRFLNKVTMRGLTNSL